MPLVLWAFTIVPPLRDLLLLVAVERDTRDYHVKRSKSPLDRLMVDVRDRVIVENIRAFYEHHGQQPKRVWAAIVFGAGHMGAIGHCLSELGFKPGTRRWFTVLQVCDDAG